jgi:hypothetical protein
MFGNREKFNLCPKHVVSQTWQAETERSDRLELPTYLAFRGYSEWNVLFFSSFKRSLRYYAPFPPAISILSFVKNFLAFTDGLLK